MQLTMTNDVNSDQAADAPSSKEELIERTFDGIMDLTDELLDRTLNCILQLTSEERFRLLTAWEEWTNGRKESTG